MYFLRNIYNLRFFSVCKCIKCDNSVNITNFFCNSCNWPLESEIIKRENIYKIFQIVEEYEIDKNLLSKRYKNYQFLLHPDHHYGRTKEELSIITANSGIINSLYNTLIDDKKRAEYLFKIRFTRYNFEEEIEKIKKNQLESVMEIYEKLDSLETLEDKNKLKAEIKSKIDSAVERIGESFHSNDVNSVTKNYVTLSFYKQIYNKLI
ncbi:Fe-S protein assembly co-chaperone HscB [Theileria parva strain Muguga]|uniref:Fe-S protein assembly co-chaperone HscB n=1 Tax=Theileria parva strain Muguga TaxID=333668 RepID=UPI001C61B411|nr:Fe-S protein assembly co-chaperone HscB [Theileria parva strain Muguga]KAF5153121.1 Fe-S protein assembly co-chaperone HscB [Theileria parva strain Muguga]